MAVRTEPVTEVRFPAMGTDVHVVVVGGDARHLDLARGSIEELEQRWSRFLPDSEINALARYPDRPVVVSAETYDLVDKALSAWKATAGRFDPTVGASMIALGYDHDFGSIRSACTEVGVTAPAPTPARIVLLPSLRSVLVPKDVVLDPGGIGKGLAADRVAGQLVDAGAEGALVNIGGDLRVIGRPPNDDDWVVTVPDPRGDAELLRLSLPQGAVATSSTLRRRWRTTDGDVHHLIDPGTGRPTDTDVISVTVVAAEAWWAEALTKALYLQGPTGLATLDGAHAVVVTADGTRHATDGIRGSLR